LNNLLVQHLLFAAEYFRLTTLFSNNSVVSRKYSAANKY